MTASSGLKQNVIATFVGRGVTAAVSVVLVPFYIEFLEVEGYGLIGLFMSLTALLMVLDMGLSTTLNRGLARLSAQKGREQDARDLVRTMEAIYWGIGAIVGAGLIAAAPVLAFYWVNPKEMSPATVEQAARIMGLVVALQWPTSLYTGGLMGLQRQVLLNGVIAMVAVLQGTGAVLVLWLVSPTVQAFFLWQAGVMAMQTLLLARCLWRSLPTADAAGGPPAFRTALLKEHWKFAAGMTGIAVTAGILTQLDKLILSKLLPLEQFAYYALATTAAGLLGYLVYPVFAALFPRFSQLVVEGKERALAELYHQGCQFVSLILLPAWVVIALFSKELLSLWLGDPTVAAQVSWLLSLVVTGTALNSVMLLPLALELAFGWTNLSVYKNVIAVIVLVPVLVWVVPRYGPVGAALVWIGLNTGYFLVEIPILHGRLLKGEMWHWYFLDVGLPLVVSTCVGVAARLALPDSAPGFLALGGVALTGLLAMAFSLLLLPAPREWLKGYVRNG